jgi:hypothetical protein
MSVRHVSIGKVTAKAILCTTAVALSARNGLFRSAPATTAHRPGEATEHAPTAVLLERRTRLAERIAELDTVLTGVFFHMRDPRGPLATCLSGRRRANVCGRESSS